MDFQGACGYLVVERLFLQYRQPPSYHHRPGTNPCHHPYLVSDPLRPQRENPGVLQRTSSGIIQTDGLEFEDVPYEVAGVIGEMGSIKIKIYMTLYTLLLYASVPTPTPSRPELAEHLVFTLMLHLGTQVVDLKMVVLKAAADDVLAAVLERALKALQ